MHIGSLFKSWTMSTVAIRRSLHVRRIPFHHYPLRHLPRLISSEERTKACCIDTLRIVCTKSALWFIESSNSFGRLFESDTSFYQSWRNKCHLLSSLIIIIHLDTSILILLGDNCVCQGGKRKGLRNNLCFLFVFCLRHLLLEFLKDIYLFLFESRRHVLELGTVSFRRDRASLEDPTTNSILFVDDDLKDCGSLLTLGHVFRQFGCTVLSS